MFTTPSLFADHTLVDDDEMAGQVAAMVRGQLRSGHDVADLLDHVAELDRSGSWALSGHRSCAAWLVLQALDGYLAAPTTRRRLLCSAAGSSRQTDVARRIDDILRNELES